MVLVHDTLSHCALEVYEVSTKKLKQCSTYRADKKMHLVVTRGKFEKINMQELWFLCRGETGGGRHNSCQENYFV